MVDTRRERLLAKTDQNGPNGCWVWQGAVANSYGIMNAGSRKGRAYVHRVSHELFIGPIPDGLHIDHLCGNRLCVNPEHLEAVTQRVNNFRTRRETCINGHPFTGENVRLNASSGQRLCVTCTRERARAKWPERKEGMAHVSTMVPHGLYSAAKAKAQSEGTTITAILTQALLDFAERPVSRADG